MTIKQSHVSQQPMMLERCRHIDCKRQADGIFSVGETKIPCCKLHLDMITGNVTIKGVQSVGFVKRPVIHLRANGYFSLSAAPDFNG